MRTPSSHGRTTSLQHADTNVGQYYVSLRFPSTTIFGNGLTVSLPPRPKHLAVFGCGVNAIFPEDRRRHIAHGARSSHYPSKASASLFEQSWWLASNLKGETLRPPRPHGMFPCRDICYRLTKGYKDTKIQRLPKYGSLQMRLFHFTWAHHLNSRIAEVQVQTR